MKNTDFNNIIQYQPYLDNMPDSFLKSYILTRVINQIDWYDKKSVHKQEMYKRLSVISIVLNGVIPVAVLLSDFGIIVKLIIATLSSTAGIINAVIALGNYKDLWVQYRLNCETLKSILYRFFLRSGEFEGFDGFDIDDPVLCNTLVTCCEGLMTKEFQSWISSTSKITACSAEKLDT